MNCKLCKESVVKDALCRTHYIKSKEEIYLDNTNIDDLGIVKWAKDMMPEHLRNVSPDKQKYIFYILLSLYDPFYDVKDMRYRQLIAFREFAKSTIIRIIIMYAIVHNNKVFKLRKYKLDIAKDYQIKGALASEEIIECKIFERFMCIVSEVGGQAEEFIVTIRDEFTTNERLKYFYHYEIRKAKDSEDGQWTRRAFKINDIYVLGLGSGQRIRGRIRGAYRLTFLFGDDIYSEDSVLTPETRMKTRRWWNRAAVNTVDTTLGKIFLVGTILHEDTILIDNKYNPQWQTVEVPVMQHKRFADLVEKHLQVDVSSGKCIIPYEDITDDYERIPKQKAYFENLEKEEDWSLEWKERVNLYAIVLKYKAAIYAREVTGFYQEFFHITVSNEQKRFKKEYFQKIKSYRIFREFGINWFECKDLFEHPQPIYIQFGIDLGTGTIDGDNAAIAIAGELPDGRRIKIKAVYGKYGYRDDLKVNKSNWQTVELDRNQVKKIGIYDECFRLAREFYPNSIRVGYSGSEKGHIDAISKFMRANNYYEGYVTGRMQMAHEGKKHDRIINTMLNKYEAMSVYHCINLEDYEYELEFLGKAVSDDIADAFECACFGIQKPSNTSYNDIANPQVVTQKGLYYPNSLLTNTEIWDWRAN